MTVKLDFEELAIARFLALVFHNAGIDPHNEWPEDAEEVTQGNCEVSIEGWPSTYKCWDGKIKDCNLAFECEGKFKSRGEWDSYASLSREDFFSWFDENKDFATRIDSVREDTVKEIARLNQIAYDAVDKAIKLSAEICVPYYCGMPSSVADLDENSDWDESRC